MEIRLISMTDAPIEIEDGLGGYLILQPGVPTPFLGEVAPNDLRRHLREGRIIIEDEPPDLPPVD